MDKKSEGISALTGLLMYPFGLLGFVAVLLAIFKGGKWLLDNVYPIASAVLLSLTVLGIVLGLVLLIPKKTRNYGAFSLIGSSFALFFTTWLWSLIMAKIFAGTIWLIVGLILGGIGVIPIALIATLIQGETSVALGIVAMITVGFVLRVAGFFFVSDLDDKTDSMDYKQPNL
jgi:hypothetical protein